MSNMSSLDIDLRAAKVLLVCVFHLNQPETTKFSGAHADKALDFYNWATRTFPCHRVAIRDGHGKVLLDRTPALRY